METLFSNLLSFLDSLAYRQPGRRDLRWDFLRGYALYSMILFHFGQVPSILFSLTGQARFFINAPLGFFFISGLVLGRLSRRLPPPVARRRLLRRTLDVYLVMLLLAYGGRFLEVATDWNLAYGMEAQALRGPALWEWALKVPLLQAYYHGSDVLAMYVFFNLLAVLVLWLLSRGRGWLAASGILGLYALHLFLGPGHPEPIAAPFSALGCLPIYFSGLGVGWNWTGLSNRWQSLPAWGRRTILAAITLGALSLWAIHLDGYRLVPWLPGLLGDRFTLAPARILPAAIFIAFFFFLLHTFWVPINALAGWFLVLLGQESLWVFGIHLFIIDVLVNMPFYAPGLAQQALLLFTVWSLTLLYHRHKTHRRASPRPAS